jgi:DNA repair ATPase RecN
MPEISNQTLVIAVQAIGEEIRELREAAASGEATIEELQLLEDRLQAAEDLERAYRIAEQTVLNLPPYDELVGNG